ncbi:hypothetical protein [Kribbella sp. DT2]|uniref:hypothetical protein n=1 Tax=Kribbella sp. DT2 TaxID=3393427 RepID=UPI003CE886BE
MVTPKRRPETPTGRARVALTIACAAGGTMFGLVAGLIAGTIFGNVSNAYDLEVLSFGVISGVLVCVAWIVWLCVRTGLGAIFGAATVLLTLIGLLGWSTGYSEGHAVAIAAFATLLGLSWLTSPGRRRRWSSVVPVVLGIAVLGTIPLAVDDLRTWRDDTKALTELIDPPLAPTAPGLHVREFHGLYTGVSYQVAETGGPPFASVAHQRVKSRPAVSDDCFSKLLDGPPMTGCTEVAPGIYRAEYVNERSDASYFLPRDNTVVTIREYVTGVNTSRYGEAGAGDEFLLRIATSLRPTPVQDLARQGCRLCRLMPN